MKHLTVKNVVPVVRGGLRDVRRKKSKKKKMSVHGIKNVGGEKGVAKRAKGRRRNDNIPEGEKGVARRAKGRKRNDNIINLDIKRRKRDNNNNAPKNGNNDVKGKKWDSGGHVRSERNDNILNLDNQKRKRDNNILEGEKGVTRRAKVRKTNENIVNLDIKRKKDNNNNVTNKGSHDTKGGKRNNNSAENIDNLDTKKSVKKKGNGGDIVAMKIPMRGRGS